MKRLIILVQWTTTAVSLWLNKLFLAPKVFWAVNLEELAEMKKENVGVVFIANHINANDPFVITAFFPKILKQKVFPLIFLAAHEKFSNPYKSFAMKLLGCIPVGNGQNVRETIKILKEGGSIFLFPEGKVSENGELGEDKRLLETLSKFSELIVQPIRIEGLKHFWDVKSMLLGHRQVKLIFGTPFFLAKGSKINAVAEIEKLSLIN